MALHHWNIFPKAKVTSFGKELPHYVSNIMPHLLSHWATQEHVLQRFHILRATMRTTLIDLCRDTPMPFVHCNRLMDSWPNDNCLHLCLTLVTNNTPSHRSAGGNSISPLIRGRLLKGLMRSNPFPPKLHRVLEGGSNHMPPPTCRIKEELVQFPKEQGELGLGTPTCQFVHPYSRHPSKDCHRWCRIPCIRFHLHDSTILRVDNKFRESAHKLCVKLNRTHARLTNTSHAFGHSIL